jgi:hypothetical protein
MLGEGGMDRAKERWEEMRKTSSMLSKSSESSDGQSPSGSEFWGMLAKKKQKKADEGSRSVV